MALYEIRLDLDPEYVQMVKSIYQFLAIIIVFHLLVSYTYNGSKPILFGLSQEFMNDHVLNLILMGMISIMSFYMVFQKILRFV
jgi:hypothetical protein